MNDLSKSLKKGLGSSSFANFAVTKTPLNGMDQLDIYKSQDFGSISQLLTAGKASTITPTNQNALNTDFQLPVRVRGSLFRKFLIYQEKIPMKAGPKLGYLWLK